MSFDSLQAHRAKVMDGTVEDVEEEWGWPGPSEGSRTESISHHFPIKMWCFRDTSRWKSSSRVGEAAQRSGRMKGSAQHDKKCFYSPPQDQRGTTWIIGLHFQLPGNGGGVNLELRIQKLRPERNREDDITGHASKNGQEPSENNKLQ